MNPFLIPHPCATTQMTDKPQRDRLYAGPRSEVGDFIFDEAVAKVFPDMVGRSVPGYGAIIDMIAVLASIYATPGSRCYDLGCSLGAAALAIYRGAGRPSPPIVAVDSSPAMLEQARLLLAEAGDPSAFELVCADILEAPIESASMAVLNFTLQFIQPALRPRLLRRIYQGLRPGGILVLSEKILAEPETTQQLFTEIHHGFKRAHGYSELEISQKRAALERVLLPETLACHTNRLREVGFATVEIWFRCFNFVSLLAIK
jgi:tRNA (cmo5U34)-methyltransferase